MKKLITLKCVLITLIYGSCFNLNAQRVFEKTIHLSSATGDVVNQDILVSQINNSGHIINSGYNLQKIIFSLTNFNAILADHNSSGTGQFLYRYAASDTDTNILNTKSFSHVEYNGGYILVGTVYDNPDLSSSVNGGGDLFILKCNSSGGVIAHKIIDMGGNEVGKAIKQMGSNSNFILCGEASYSGGSSTGFIMKIDNNLNIAWKKEYDLRLNSSNPTINPFNDVVYDGSNIWAVGNIKEVSGSLRSGIVVKLNSSGTYQTSRRLSDSPNRVFLNHVEDDGSNLIITGNQPVKLGVFNAYIDRMMAIRYNKSAHSIVKDLRLGLSTVGYDIMKSGIGGNTNYYVVGRRASSGTLLGLLYILNSSFIATNEVNYSYTNDTELFAIDTLADDTCNYLVMSGYDGSTSNKRGYFNKTTLLGITSCEDSVAIDTSELSLTVNTLIDSVDTNYSYFSNIVYRDTLVDSLLCDDTLSTCNPGALRQGLFNNIEETDIDLNQNLVYPNPVNRGEVLRLALNKNVDKIKQLKVVSSIGQIIIHQQNITTNSVSIKTDGLSKGVYFIYFEYDNSDPEVLKFIVK